MKLPIKANFLYLTFILTLFTVIACNESTDTEKEEACTKTCETGFTLNEENCECEKDACTNTCETGFTLNADTCECEKEACTNTCDAGFILNADTCECEKEECTKTCSAGFTLNEDTCECEEDPFIPVTITVDTSTATLAGDWKKRTTIEGYTGEGYIVWEGASQFWKGDANIGNAGRLTYKVNITTPGTYLFRWRSYIAKKDPEKPWAEHNDSWLRIPDADNFFAKKESSILYPKGSGKSPNPAGENGNGFFKIFMNINDQWTTASATSDHNAHQVYVTFDTAKEYTIEIAARSNFHAIDSFSLILQKP